MSFSMHYRSPLLSVMAASWLIPLALFSTVSADDAIVYNRDIRPILSDNCFHCHGNDKNKIKGKLKLNDRESAVAKKAIVPGKPDESELVHRIFSNDEEELMPPPESHKKLSASQKDLLKRWVASGAAYQPHWAYIVPTRPALPKTADASWVRNPIDTFVLANLEAKKLSPSPQADRRTLLRRLSLDLIGLPPTSDEADAFVKDARPDAYELQVDRLLASPRFGERMAVPWLDAVRFSDTVGFHGDQNQNIFPYRDYVISAFNSNKPFDQFTIEQLAGDLLPNATNEQLVASGFNRLNMMTREGGAQPKEYIAKYTADRIRTVSLTWLGSTFGCAECHDHKFDPISTKDFYSLGAYFADVRQWGVYSDYSYTPNPDLKGWSNDHPFPPEIQVGSPYLKAKQARLEKLLTEEMRQAFARLSADAKFEPTFNEWQASAASFLKKNPTGWAITSAVPAGKPSTQPSTKPAGPSDGFIALKAAAKAAPNDVVLHPAAGWIASIRLEVAGDLKTGTLNNGSQRQGIRLSASVKGKTGAARKIAIYHADAAVKEPRYASTDELLGVKDGWKLSAAQLKKKQASYWLLDPPVKLAEGDTLTVSIAGDSLIPIRLSVSPLASWDALDIADKQTIAAVLATPAERSREQSATIYSTYLIGTAADADSFTRYKQLQRQILECRDGKAWTQITVARDPIPMRVLPRGNWQDETGAAVVPETPHFLGKLPGTDGRRQNRLDLAKWITSAENPLTARTISNRFWKMFFGTGLCASVEDLGAQGEWPSHPELLDWLAVEFRTPEAGTAWDVKHLVRLMVTSNTYRQASNLQPALRDIDPGNRLLASQSPRRLEAEFVRDNALFAAGLLNLDLGGPSAYPYQPEGYYAAIQFPNRSYIASADERQYRRGVYSHWQRTFMHPMLANFDAPSREDSACARIVSNTPQQALTLLNDPSFVEASRVLAEKLISGGGSDAEKIDRLYLRVLSRMPKAKERDSLIQFLLTQRETYKRSVVDAQKLLSVGNAPMSGTDAAELAAWANTCRVVLNLHESITRF